MELIGKRQVGAKPQATPPTAGVMVCLFSLALENKAKHVIFRMIICPCSTIATYYLVLQSVQLYQI